MESYGHDFTIQGWDLMSDDEKKLYMRVETGGTNFSLG